ncbi:uncharacterized protein LOC119181439 isoform X2 [Rhipicephalus microplus]|uniref:uncharacterized protein LOC119181439 isoform X2 n=1 Tax=Rhipicephalus microplus TaxID=6941 RepID=UPI003F6AB123
MDDSAPTPVRPLKHAASEESTLSVLLSAPALPMEFAIRFGVVGVGRLSVRQWPVGLSTVLAKTVAHQMNTSLKLKAGGYTDEDLAVSRLRATAMEALAEQCALWREQPELAQELPHTPAATLPLSAYGVRNNRRKMEDRHLALPDLNFALGLQGLPQYSYYAVFDGHAGVEAADYATAHLHRNIAVQPDFVTDPVNAVREGFLLTDRNFLQRSSREGLKSGCTAVCCLVREQRQLVVGWLGDSQAILVRKGIPIPLVNPHKPEREDERKRIEELGGVVLLMGIWRVNGALGVSRAIGDAEHKPFVTSEPDVVSMDLDGTEDFLVLGCDGLWDQLSPKNVASRVYHAVLEDPESAPYVSHTLVQTARDMGSSDNITAIVVFLRDPRDFKPCVLDIVDYFPNPVPGNEVPATPAEDAKEAFNASEFDASRFNSNGYGAHLFDAEAVNSHTYEHAAETEMLQVASDVVQGTIETALHRVNEDVITAGQIVDQVHLLHTEESGKFSDLPEQFHGAIPTDGSLEDKFDQPDGISHAANGYGDNIPERQAVHHNPFDDEGYGHDLETAECLQSSGIGGTLEESGTESAERFSSFAEGANEASSQLEMPQEQTFCTAPSPTQQHQEFDTSFDQEVDARQPSPVGQHMLPQDPLLAAGDLVGAPAEPAASREAELPDEGVDVSTLPEDVQEMEAAKEQHGASAIQDECLSTLPEDQQDCKLAQLCDMDSVVLPDAAEHVAAVAEATRAVRDAETIGMEHSDDIHGNMLSPGNNQEGVQQLDHLYENAQQSDLNKEEMQLAQPLEPEHVKDGTDADMAASGLSYNQPLSLQSDDLVSIDLNSSAMQSLAEASAPPHAADSAFICETVAVPHEDTSMAYVTSENAQNEQPVCETLESLGTDDADDTSLGGSAESIVEKVTAEPVQQDSAVIFCELKESPPVENILNVQSDESEQKVDDLCYNIPVQQQEQVPAEVSYAGSQDSFVLGSQVSEPFVQDSFAVPTSTENSFALEHPPEEPSLQSPDSLLQVEPQQPATAAISPVGDAEQPCEPSYQNLSEEAQSPHLQSQSPAIEEHMEQKSVALNVVHCMSENTKPTVDETPAPVVDVGAIPENIPEADGVTDSDSERDNEWRFVKPVEPVISQLAKEAGQVPIQGSQAAEMIHAEQKEAASSELVQSTAETSASEPKVDAVSDTKQDLLPETKAEVDVAAAQKDTLPERKASAAKLTSGAKLSPAAQKTKPAAKASPAPKPRTSSTDKPAAKPLPSKTEPSSKATPATKSPLKKQPVATKPTTATTTAKQSTTASSTTASSTTAKTNLTRKPEPLKPKSATAATDAPTKKPVSATSRPSAGSTRPAPSKPPEKSTAPASKAKPTAPSSTAPRPRTTIGSALTSSASKAEVGTAEKKPTTKPAPTRPPISRTAPKSMQPASSSSAPRVGSSTTANRPTTAPISRPGTTSRVGSASTAAKKVTDAAKKVTDAGAAAVKTSSARVPATRDAKLGKDSTNQQLAGARRTEITQRSAASRTATASKTAATKPTTTSKYAAVRAVPKGGGTAAAAAKAAAAENQSNGEPAANCNGTPEEKGTLEQKDNKEAFAPAGEPGILSNGSHPESDEIAKPAAIAENMPDVPAVDV